MAGLDVAMIFALIGAIVAEFVGARAGLGMLIQSMNFNMDVSGQFSVLLILSDRGTVVEPMYSSNPPACPLLGSLGKGTIGAGKDNPMKRTLIALVTCLLVAVSVRDVLAQTSKLRVGFCSRVISSAAAPFAVATKMGWYKEDGVEVELAALAGSADCVKTTATKEIPFSLPSVEPLAAARPAGRSKRKFFIPRTRGISMVSRCRLKVPSRRSPTSKGRPSASSIMGSGGVPVAKALISTAGMNPDTDVNIVVAGEGAQTAAMLRSKQVDALSQFDTQYAMVENAGVKLRLLDTKEIDRYPSNGFLALEETLSARKRGCGRARARLCQRHDLHHQQP